MINLFHIRAIRQKFLRIAAVVMVMTIVPSVFSASAREKMSEGVSDALRAKLAQTVDIDYRDADLSSVLRSLSWTYELNIVTGPNVKGKISISLKEIALEEALEAIVSVSGLLYSKRGEVIYIAEGDKDVVDMSAEVYRLKYIQASEAANLLKNMMSPKGDLKVNEIDNSIVVSDYTANLEKVKDLIEKIDLAPKQVLIEAKIVDITSSDLESLGVTWNFDYDPTKGGLFSRDTLFDENLDATGSFPTTSTGLTGGQLKINTLTVKGLTITATLDALVRDGKARLLASPSIAVLNGQEARIVIGERFPYKERTQTTSGTTETTRFVDIGTTLRVKAFINDDGYITLDVHPEVSSLEAALDAGPRITTREADTTVRVKAGETIVIGGLIKQQDEGSEDKVPFLGDLPLVGLLFSRSTSSNTQTELAVFITVKILRSREEQERMGRKAEQERYYTLSDETGQLNMGQHLFEKAKQLEAGKGVISMRKSMEFRMLQALSIYEHINSELPSSPDAPAAGYHAGKIYAEYLQDTEKACDLFARVVSDHPDSEYAILAQRAFRIHSSEAGRS